MVFNHLNNILVNLVVNEAFDNIASKQQERIFN